MREPEQFIVPALGVLVLLGAIVLGTSFFSWGYTVVLGLLGLAAVGTYFVPPAVQVETRIAISCLGLLVLIFMFSSLGFWMALVGLGAIGALQIRHRDTLQLPLHTVGWLKTLQIRPGGTEASPVQAEAGDGENAASESAATSVPAAAPQTGAAGTARAAGLSNIGGIGAAVLGVIILLSFLLPWITVSASVGGLIGGGLSAFSGGGGEVSHSESASGWELVRFFTEVAEEESEPGLYSVTVIGGIIAVLGGLGIASIVLPRVVPIIVGIAGTTIMTLLAMGFFAALDAIKSSELGQYLEYGSMLGFEASVSLGMGFWIILLAFVAMFVLQLVFKQRS